MNAVVTMKEEYRNHDLVYVAKYNSFYDIYYKADRDNDMFMFILVDNDPSLDNIGKFAFGKICSLFLPNIECIYAFIKKADIRINKMGLTHIINLKKNKLIN